MRIARDLHDSAGHAINVILVHAGLGRLRTETDAAGAREALETIEEVARETAGEIDQLVGVLREGPATGEVEPPPGVAAVAELVARHRDAGLDVSLDVRRGAPRAAPERRPRRLPHPAGGAHQRRPPRRGSGRGARALRAGRARAERREPARRRADRRGGNGHGVIGMRERADLLGGDLEAGAQDGRYRVTARLPLPAE